MWKKQDPIFQQRAVWHQEHQIQGERGLPWLLNWEFFSKEMQSIKDSYQKSHAEDSQVKTSKTHTGNVYRCYLGHKFSKDSAIVGKKMRQKPHLNPSSVIH